MSGRRVGRYELHEEVGRGGMSVVHRAVHVDLGREVALKELAAFHSASPGAAERFVRESQLAGALSHPHVVTVHDFFEEDGTAFIAMEYLARGSLRPLVGTLDLPQIAGVLDAVLSALGRAEEVGVVHRDLKPENLMLTAEGSVKITDFGIAKAQTTLRGGAFATAPGTTVGTPEYMAPEQALGGDMGPWTDLYAVGVIAYELLTGSVPFVQGAEEAPLALLLRHVNDPVEPVRERVPQVDAELAAWVHRLLAKDPADRPGSAVAAAEELEEIATRLAGPRWRRDARLPVPAHRPAPQDGAATGPESEDARARAGAETVAPRHPRRAPADLGGSPAGARVGGHRRQLVLLLMVTAGGGALAGIATRDGSGDPATGARVRAISGTAVTVRVPAEWAVNPSLVPPAASGGTGANGPQGESLWVGTTAGHGPTLLPAALRPAGVAPRRVRLGSLDALRYTDGRGSLWAIALRRGVLVVRCGRASDTCARAAATVRARSQPASPAGPTADYAARVRAALTDPVRRAGEVAAARTLTGRARSSGRLRDAAAASLIAIGVAPGAWEAGAHPPLQAALRGLRDRAAALARATRSGRRAPVRAAEAALGRAIRALQRAQRELRALGYRP